MILVYIKSIDHAVVYLYTHSGLAEREALFFMMSVYVFNHFVLVTA